MIERVKKYIRENQMLKAGDIVAAGVSGGADSIAMLHILKSIQEEFGFFLEAVHVHHGIRGDEADRDENLVKKICQEWKIPFQSYHYPVPELSRKWRLGEEETGRIVRKQAFAKEKQRIAFSEFPEENERRFCVALAHNRNDLAETMLHHLARGTGLRGLSGIHPCSDGIIRPVLCLERREIVYYLEENEISYITDSSNLSDGYTRNRIRHHVLEELKTEVNPQAVRHMAQLSEELEEAREVLDRLAEKERKRYVKEDADGAILLEALKKEPDLISRQIIHTLLKEISGKQKNFTRIHIEAVQQLWKQKVGARRDLPYEMQARRTYDGILLGQKKEKTSNTGKNEAIPVTVQSSQSESFQAGDLILTVSLISRDFGKIQEKKYTKWFDYDRIEQKLVIRHRQPGDRICLFDGGGSKKLKDYLIDRKIPVEERDQLWLLADGSEILWIIGDRISAAYKVKEQSSRILQAEIKGGSTHE